MVLTVPAGHSMWYILAVPGPGRRRALPGPLSWAVHRSASDPGPLIVQLQVPCTHRRQQVRTQTAVYGHNDPFRAVFAGRFNVA